jgi:hypothetical protein
MQQLSKIKEREKNAYNKNCMEIWHVGATLAWSNMYLSGIKKKTMYIS